MDRVWDWIVSNSVVLLTLFVIAIPYIIWIGIIAGIVLLIRYVAKKHKKERGEKNV